MDLSFTGTWLLYEYSLYVYEKCAENRRNPQELFTIPTASIQIGAVAETTGTRINEAKVLHKREPFKLLRGKKS